MGIPVPAVPAPARARRVPLGAEKSRSLAAIPDCATSGLGSG